MANRNNVHIVPRDNGWGTLLMGNLPVDGLEPRGPMSPLADLFRDALMHRYEKAAWMALSGFLVVAIKPYRKDQRRLLGL